METNPLQNEKVLQQFADLQSISHRLSFPWLTELNTIGQTIEKLYNPFSEVMKAYSSLEELYRISNFNDSSAIRRHDSEDGLPILKESSLSTTTEEEQRITVEENTREKDVNKENREYLDYLRSRSYEVSNIIARTEFEDGMDNDITRLIRSFTKKNKSATYNWIDELFSMNLSRPKVVEGLLRTISMITEKGDENILLPIVVAGLRSENAAEQESAIMVIEEWRTRECLEALRSVTNYPSDIIASYANKVMKELEEELYLC